MAGVENLEKLSNNEIRLKCIEFGLPNVPVTDSSRKLLIKRLNDAMNNASTKDTVKASNRRETINVGKAAPTEVDVQKTRRTISAATSVPAKEDNAPTAIPISTRRRSVQKDSTESIKPTKGIMKPLQTILIEDDEDDIDLISAAENAEKASTTSSTVPIENIPSRRKSRSVSVPKVTEVINTAAKKHTMTPLAEEKLESVQYELPSKNIKPQSSQSEDVVNIISVEKLPTLDSPVALTQQSLAKANTVELPSYLSKQNTTPSVYSTPSSMRYTAGLGAASTTATVAGGGYLGSSSMFHRSKLMSDNYLNEVSDNDFAEDDCKSPFLSNFARDLERRRSIGRGTGNTYNQYVRLSGGSAYDPCNIRGRGSKAADVSVGQIMRGLSRKYHLKTIFCILALACISIFIYVYLYA